MTRTRRAAALLLVTITATAACSGDSDGSPAPVPAPSSASPSSWPGVTAPDWSVKLQNAGFSPPAEDSLAADTGLTRALRQEVFKYLAKHKVKYRPPAPDNITVVSAGDVGEVRYAEIVFPRYRGTDVTEWVRSWWLGPAGSDATDLRASYIGSNRSRVSDEPEALFLSYEGDEPGGVVVVSAPGAKKVSLPGGSPELKPDGGAGWAVTVADAVLREHRYLVDGTAGVNTLRAPWDVG